MDQKKITAANTGLVNEFNRMPNLWRMIPRPPVKTVWISAMAMRVSQGVLDQMNPLFIMVDFVQLDIAVQEHPCKHARPAY